MIYLNIAAIVANAFFIGISVFVRSRRKEPLKVFTTVVETESGRRFEITVDDMSCVDDRYEFELDGQTVSCFPLEVITAIYPVGSETTKTFERRIR